jgi:hypothetical protein
MIVYQHSRAHSQHALAITYYHFICGYYVCVCLLNKQASPGYIYFSNGPIDRGTFDADNWEKGVYSEEQETVEDFDAEPAVDHDDQSEGMKS